MKKQNGITLIALTITIVLMMILAGITTYFGKDLVKEAKLQDLRTNMLLIQAKAKACVEEVSFQTANMDPNNVEDAAKIETIKGENLKGKLISTNSEVKSQVEATGLEISSIDEYYYFDEQDLEDMGIEKLSTEDYGYFVVRYDIENIKVEIINTKGYKGNYTLEQLNQITEEE